MPSSLGRILASRANGARSHSLLTRKESSSSRQNATRDGLLARCIVMDKESLTSFEALWRRHLESLQPVGGVELDTVEEMAAAYWRMRRALALETRMLQNAANVPAGESDSLGPIAAGFSGLANSPALALMHRYETRLHLVYQCSLHYLLLLRALAIPNEPSPISGHSDRIDSKSGAGPCPVLSRAPLSARVSLLVLNAKIYGFAARADPSRPPQAGIRFHSQSLIGGGANLTVSFRIGPRPSLSPARSFRQPGFP